MLRSILASGRSLIRPRTFSVRASSGAAVSPAAPPDAPGVPPRSAEGGAPGSAEAADASRLAAAKFARTRHAIDEHLKCVAVRARTLRAAAGGVVRLSPLCVPRARPSHLRTDASAV